MNHIARGGKIVYSKYFLKRKKEKRKVGKLDKNSVKTKIVKITPSVFEIVRGQQE